jgi:MoxR-like ATPase
MSDSGMPRVPFWLYAGDGSTLVERNLAPPEYVDLFPPATESYIADPALASAVNTAISLGIPLLVSGEPGTGKTQLAASVARELMFQGPFVFNCKTTSTARDLFYVYDGLRNYRDVLIYSKSPLGAPEGQSSGARNPPEARDYIRFSALGQAILLSRKNGAALSATKKRSVVLIDEIDKAPRDFPNDLLNELAEFSFEVYETGDKFQADAASRPIIIITSNSEKALPDAFLRRCAYYHIEPPSAEKLESILKARFGKGESKEQFFKTAVTHFQSLRLAATRKKPSTAELIAWVALLGNLGVEGFDNTNRATLLDSCVVLGKTLEDAVAIQNKLSQELLKK